MATSQGIFKQTRILRQTVKGTLAAAGGAAQILRREQSTFELEKESYTTESEITSTQQLTSSRHGVKLVNGKVTGILSPLTYSDPLSAVLRRDFTAVTAITGASITIAGAGPSYTLTRAAGSFLTDNIKVGYVVRLSVGAFTTSNINKNLLVTGVTALVLTVSVLNNSGLVAEGPIITSTVSVPGKITFTPTTGHTVIFHTVEEWMPDVPTSERNLDVKFTQANISLPGSGNAKIDFTANGLNQTQLGTAYFSAPVAETTTQSLVAASGVLLVGGVAQAAVTDLSISTDGKGKPADGVVGSDVRPDIFTGKMMASGSFTAYFDSVTLANLFINETSSSIVSALTAGSAANADFMTFTMSDVRINSATPTDEETGCKRTYSYTAVLNAAGGVGVATEKTTLQVQDSAA